MQITFIDYSKKEPKEIEILHTSQLSESYMKHVRKPV